MKKLFTLEVHFEEHTNYEIGSIYKALHSFQVVISSFPTMCKHFQLPSTYPWSLQIKGHHMNYSALDSGFKGFH